jgi:hypothetical protein
MSNDIAYYVSAETLRGRYSANLHPAVPVLGDAVRAAVTAPPACSPVFGIVHWASVTLNETDVPALPSVGGGLKVVSSRKCQESMSILQRWLQHSSIDSISSPLPKRDRLSWQHWWRRRSYELRE